MRPYSPEDVKALVEAMLAAEDLLAFHEGSAKPEFEGAHPTVRVNGDDWAELTLKVRAALAPFLGGGQ
jgi:hypothetical protein